MTEKTRRDKTWQAGPTRLTYTTFHWPNQRRRIHLALQVGAALFSFGMPL